MLTISKLKRWSINYYIDTARAAEHAARDLARAGGVLLRTRNPHPDMAVGRGQTHRRQVGRPDRRPARRGRRSCRDGGPLARRRHHT